MTFRFARKRTSTCTRLAVLRRIRQSRDFLLVIIKDAILSVGQLAPGLDYKPGFFSSREK